MACRSRSAAKEADKPSSPFIHEPPQLRQVPRKPRTNAPREARNLYLRALRDFPDDPVAPRALYGLGQLRVDPKSPLRDYAVARTVFGRVATRYPSSAWAPQARAWHAVLTELLKHEADAARTRVDLERLKELDKELEEP